MACFSFSRRICLLVGSAASLLLLACSPQTTDDSADRALAALDVRPKPAAGDSDVLVTTHDDLVSAGLSLDELRGASPAPSDPEAPSADELRAMAFHTQFNSLSALRTADGLGTMTEAGLPRVAGVEIMTLRRVLGQDVPGQDHFARALLQIPDSFDEEAPCLVVAPASGSRGVYGAVPLAAPWALPKGCAIVYSDKAAGTDYFDFATQTGVELNGQRGALEETDPVFVPSDTAVSGPLVATAHAHSQINVEALWGEITLDAARWALGQLAARGNGLNPDQVTVIAAGLSNGGQAVLRALEADEAGIIDAVVSVMPNITPPQAPHLYEYAATAALYQPCLLGDADFAADLPFANPLLIGAGRNRCQSLAEAGLLDEASPQEARRVLSDLGFDPSSLSFSAAIVALDVWRAVLVNYSAAYLAAPADGMPCGFRFEAPEASLTEKQNWWASTSGSPPGNGVVLVDTMMAGHPTDRYFPGLRCLAELTDDRRLQAATAATRAKASWPHDIPVFIVHGQHDALIPAAFSSRPYVAQARANGMSVDYREISGAQHFDAFLNVLPGEHAWVPILPEGWAALDRAWSALEENAGRR